MEESMNNYKMGETLSNDINYIISIINSDLTEEAKAINIYLFYDYWNLNNDTIYNNLKVEQVLRLKEFLNYYKNYKTKKIFESIYNPYKCTLEEIALRLKKLNIVSEIINSNDSDYNKVEKILSCFKSSEEFRKSYKLLLKHGKNDDRLNIARDNLDNCDFIYSKLKEYESKDIFDSVKYILSIDHYIKNYKYASFIIKNYIESQESYKESEFLSTVGLDKESFDYCVKVIEELDIDLYKQFLKKKEFNNEIYRVKNSETISDLVNGITTGFLTDGTKFDLLEFIKRVPFKKNNKFLFTLIQFMKDNNIDGIDTIRKYVTNNFLNTSGTFDILNLKDIYNTKVWINNVELTNDDNNTIIDYLKVNEIPLVYKTYTFARTKYLNGEINIEELKEKKKQQKLNEKQKIILIPGKCK